LDGVLQGSCSFPDQKMQIQALPLASVYNRCFPGRTGMAQILFSIPAHHLAFMATDGALDNRFGSTGRRSIYLNLAHAYTVLFVARSATKIKQGLEG
jgi:hypothetical protein